VELIWTAADASEYLPAEGNKLERVLGGLRRLRDGTPDRHVPGDGLPADHDKLREVVADLATRLVTADVIDIDRLENALAKDGFALAGDQLIATRSEDEPADRLAEFLDGMFGTDAEFEVARNHYRQAAQAFERKHWEAANAQFRSALDAAYDALAAKNGAPNDKTGGAARKWLADHELLDVLPTHVVNG
jgi:hypothetical protein